MKRTHWQLLAAAGYALLALPATAANWPMFRHDPAHTGATSESLQLPLKRAWSYPTKGQFILSSAAVVDGVVYFGTKDQTNGDGAPPVPAASGGGLGSMYAVNATTGKLVWRYYKTRDGKGIGPVYSSPAVVGGKVYFSARDGYFYCLNAKDGSEVWRYKTGGSYDSSSPAVVDGKVYFASGFPNKDFFCLNAATGDLIWRTPSGNATRPGQFAYSSPAVANGTVYAGANDAVFYALNAANGKVQWRFETSGTVDLFSPTIYKGRLFAAPGEFNPHVYAVNLENGKEAWSYKATGQSFFISSTAAANDTIYIGSGMPDQHLYAINALTGEEKWRQKLGFSWIWGYTSSPAIAGNVVVVGAGPETSEGDEKGRLLALDAKTGAVKWKETLPKPVIASPAVSNGMVFVGAMDGTMYAYRSAGAAPASATAKKAATKPKAAVKAAPVKKKR